MKNVSRKKTKEVLDKLEERDRKYAQERTRDARSLLKDADGLLWDANEDFERGHADEMTLETLASAEDALELALEKVRSAQEVLR